VGWLEEFLLTLEIELANRKVPRFDRVLLREAWLRIVAAR
jgi:hypothetical protein